MSMLTQMRGFANSWIAKVLFGLLALAFVSWGIFANSASSGIFDAVLSLTGWGPKDMAKVGSVTINGDEFTKTLQRQLKSMAAQTGQNVTIDDAHKMGLDRQVLDNLIAQAAVGVEARSLKLSVSPAVIQGEMMREKSFQGANGQFDPVAFRRALENNGMTEAAYVALQTRMHTDAAILDTASGDTILPKAFADALNQYQGEARDVKYFDVTVSEADVAKPTDAEIDAQYKKTPDAYTAPEYRTGALLSVDAASLAAQQTLTPEELQAGYDKYKAEYFQPEKRTLIQLPFPSVDAAKKAKERITAGEDIIKIAGELGLKDTDVTLTDKVKGDFLDKKIGEAAFALTEGQVSDPIEGGLAIAVIKAVKVNPAKQPTLEEVKDQLTQRLQLEKAKARMQEVYDAVETARTDKMKFEDIAARAGIKFTEVPAISASGQGQDGKDIDLPSKPDVLKALFASDTGVENDALGVGDGYVWYEVRSAIPSALRPLDQVKDQVTKDIIAQRLRAAAASKAKTLVDALTGGKTIEAVAQENNVTVKTVADLKRNQQTPEFDGAALNAAYSVPDQGFGSSLGGDGKSARVIQVVKVALPAVMATSPDLENIKKQVRTAFGNDMQFALVKALRKSAGVKINDALWKLDTGGEAPPAE
ncbi:MAG: SurA N-terminal domain-containing protein [Alphaproteobacteria bacterium]|nr:SurA N-terminal domain-containing protein [Alphaproteobacteria bacterium]